MLLLGGIDSAGGRQGGRAGSRGWEDRQQVLGPRTRADKGGWRGRGECSGGGGGTGDLDGGDEAEGEGCARFLP